MKLNVTFFCVLLFLLQSCNSKKEIFCDLDNIGSVKHKKYDYESNLKTNYFIFYKDGKLYVPPIANHFEETEGNWDIVVKNGKINSLIIKSKNNLFNGSYKVRFLTNKVNSRLFVELKSDSLEIILYNYFRTLKERDNYIDKFNIVADNVSDDYFPQLSHFPDNRKTLD